MTWTRIGRIAWTAALLVLAVIAGFAQLDRAAHYQPQLAPLVPAPFAAFASEELARADLAAGRSTSALRRTRHLLRVRPAPAEHLSLLAQAALLEGDPARAGLAIDEAGRRSWRDPFTQVLLAEASLAEGRYPAAAQRLAALLATKGLPAQTDSLLHRLLALPEGREALARLAAEGGYWIVPLQGRASVVARPEDLADFETRARRYGATI